LEPKLLGSGESAMPRDDLILIVDKQWAGETEPLHRTNKLRNLPLGVNPGVPIGRLEFVSTNQFNVSVLSIHYRSPQ
jgi:hypothetical protein